MTHREVVARMPWSIACLPRDHRDYPVPWFVAWVDGRPDFRVVDQGRPEQAVREQRCWTCGGPLRAPCAFVIGPMCAINQTSAEPPSHVECALYSARACPFLARPKMTRGSDAIEGVDHEDVPGIMLARNPGVALVWISATPSYDPGSRLFDIGEPERVRWFARSRPATRDEVMESISSGLPALLELAEQDGPDAVVELAALTGRAMTLVPA